MIPKYTPFKKVFNYKTDMDIHIWQSVLSNKSYRFKFLKEMHKNHHLYTYCISSRTGVIRIDLKKRGDILKLQIREGVFGFFLPFLAAAQGTMPSGLLPCGCFDFELICLAFKRRLFWTKFRLAWSRCET